MCGSLLEKIQLFYWNIFNILPEYKCFLLENIYWIFIVNLPEKCSFLPDGLFIAILNSKYFLKVELLGINSQNLQWDL